MFAITGAAGFIGSILALELNKLGIKDLLLVDTLGSSKKWKNLQNIEFVDILTPENFFTSFYSKKIKTVFHLGACSSTTQTDADFLLENNYRYSQRIFEFCTLKQINLLYASSGATYGLNNSFDDDHQLLTSLRPLNAYGFSKKIFDDWVMQQKERPPMWFGLKFFNVFGPNEYHKGPMASVALAAYNQFKDSGKVKLFKSYDPQYADGEQKRDFVYVFDVCKAMIELSKITNPLKNGIFNLGTGVERSFNDLVSSCAKSLDKECVIHYISMPEELKNQYQYFTKANMQKFFNVLPHFKFQRLEESVDDYIKNYLLKELHR